jgi:hypothetical protein
MYNMAARNQELATKRLVVVRLLVLLLRLVAIAVPGFGFSSVPHLRWFL